MLNNFNDRYNELLHATITKEAAATLRKRWGVRNKLDHYNILRAQLYLLALSHHDPLSSDNVLTPLEVDTIIKRLRKIL